jgi:hypothetical protein
MDRVPRQRLLLFASWVVTTMVATVISAAGVSIVTRDVTDDHTAALRRADVVALLAAPVAADPTSSVVPPPSPAPTAPPATEAPTTAPPTAPPATVAPPAPTTAPPPPPPPPTTTVPPLGEVAAETYSSEGGSMTVACFGDAMVLVSARPNDGYRFVVQEDGPEWVFVRFENDERDDRDGLAAWCRDGAPTADRDHRGPGGGDGDHDGDDWSGDGWSGDGRRGGR